MKFEWDEEKNNENIRKHGIDFVDVPEIFDWYMLIDLDTREEYGEDRYIGIGILHNMITVVVYTERQDETIRLISARKANKHERKKYQDVLPD